MENENKPKFEEVGSFFEDDQRFDDNSGSPVIVKTEPEDEDNGSDLSFLKEGQSELFPEETAHVEAKKEVKPESEPGTFNQADFDEPADAGSSDFSVLPIIEAISEKLEWEFDPKEFEGLDTGNVETLTDYILATIEENSRPEYASDVSKQFDEYLRRGGNPENFLNSYNSPVNYSDIDLSDDDNLRNLAIEYFTKQGHSVEEVGEIVDNLEESNTIGKMAPKFVKYLETNQATELAKQEEQRNAVLAQEYEKAAANLESIKSFVMSANEIGGIPFKDDKDKEGYLKFGFVPDKNGLTPLQKRMQEDPTLEHRLIMMAYKNVDKTKMASYGEDAAAKKLKENIVSFKSQKGAGGSSLDNRAKTSDKFQADDWVL